MWDKVGAGSVLVSTKLGQVGTVGCAQQLMFWRECLCGCGSGWLVAVKGGGALTVWSVSVPGPHSHPAAVERGGKDINKPSGIRAHSEE